MSKVLSFTIIFIICSNIYSQETKLNPNLLTFPVSPEAGRLGTFGDIPVNLSSGQLNKSIELFTGVVGDYKVPINLSYNYAGNRMEEEPSIAGLGWQLNMGGVVTKEVRGLPDETIGFGYFDSTIQNLLNPYFNSGTITDITSKEIASGHLDTEADKYHLSVNGISFSFKIGFDGQPVFLSTHGYKLQIVRGNNPQNTPNINQKEIVDFILTDTNANQYHFEQRETTEIMNADDYFNAPSNFISSWQLSKTILNNGSIIEYNYQDDSYTTKSFYGNLMVRNDQLVPDVDLYSEGFSTYFINRKLLTTISSDNFKIYFDITSLNNQDVYRKMTIKDFLNSNVYIYDFSYEGVRNCLVKINKNNDFFYEFKYNEILDSFIINDASRVKNQDYWGFSNGANNSYFVNGPDNSTYRSNRNPNFTATSAGAMKEIKYPTKGITIIDYEQNSVPYLNSESGIEPNVGMHLKFKSDNSSSEPRYKEFVFTKTFATDVVAELSHSISNVNYVSVSINSIDPNPCPGGINSPNYYNVLSGTSVLPTICLRLNDIEQVDGCTSADCSVSRSSGEKFKISAGTYEFKISTNYNYLNLNAEIFLRYFEASLDTGQFSKSDVGGIRVKSTHDIDTNSLGTYSYYDYDDNPSNTIVSPTLQHTSSYGVSPYIVNQPQGWFDPYYYGPGIPVTNYSKTGYTIFTNYNAQIFYAKVKQSKIINTAFVEASFPYTNKIYKLKNWDNSYIYGYLGGVGVIKKEYPQGYTEATFESPYTIYFDYPYAPSGKDLSGVREMGNSVLSKSDSNNNSTALMTQSFAYINLNSINSGLVNNSNSPKSLKVGYIFDRGSLPLAPNRSINTYYKYQTYRENDYEFLKTQINTKEYFNGQFVEKNTQIEYDSHNQQHLITTSDSQNNLKTTELLYPYDFTDVVSQNMVSKNSISPLVQVVNKKNGEILESSKFEYGQISNNLFKPFSFSKSKGNNSLEKRNIFDYDSNGNITTTKNIYWTGTSPGGATLYDGSNTTIVWGYNKSQIVAKIENATYSSINPSSITAIETASSSGTEASLLTALSNLRNDPSLVNAMVTTYTYKPLIGVSTITDPKGDKITYEYDEFNRLKLVKDKDGNILSENEYHYKN